MPRKKAIIYEDENIVFCVDTQNKGAIFDFFHQKGKEKLQRIFVAIRDKTTTKDIYGTEHYTTKVTKVSAIKLKGKHFNNARIYCQDYVNKQGKREVVLSILHFKKSQKLRQEEKNIINKVNEYEYE